jgi:hypothetical protein
MFLPKVDSLNSIAIDVPTSACPEEIAVISPGKLVPVTGWLFVRLLVGTVVGWLDTTGSGAGATSSLPKTLTITTAATITTARMIIINQIAEWVCSLVLKEFIEFIVTWLYGYIVNI